MTSVPPPFTLPGPDGDWSSWLDQRARGELDRARVEAGRLRDLAGAAPADIVGQWNALAVALSNAGAVASLLSQVHPAAEIRAQAEAIEQDLDKLVTDLTLDRGLYDVLAGVDAAALDDDARRVHRLALRDFTRAGVHLDDDSRARLRELSERETALVQEFSKNIREDVRSIQVTRAQLAGLPDDYIAAHPADESGMHTITTDYPDVYPFLTFAEDAAARRQLHVEFLRRAWPANEEVLRALLEARAEHARLLGHDNWPDYDAEVKMIGAGDAIGAFIDKITAAADTSGRRDRDVLLERLRVDRPDAVAIDRADATHYAELVRRERYDVDAQESRRYFDFVKVRQGLLDVTGALFGLRYEHVADAPTWHDDVEVYDVALGDEPLGRIYLDLHPREGKYKHAAQFDLARGVLDRQRPEGVLVCNFSRGLMEHTDVVTLFHEFGHLVHHIVAGRHRWVRFSGVATEWDFVEAPSQLLEEWAWDADILRGFATDGDGEPIPASLVARMRAARDFGRGYQARTQMFYAAISYRLHRDEADDLTAFVRRLQDAYDLFPYVDGTHFHTSFGHLGGYTSAYYTYMWSLVIAKDLFSAFDPANLLDPEVAGRYRDAILAPGGSRDAADLVEDFLGRPYAFDAFGRWLDQD